jgi:hypothetical protein
MEEKRGLKKVEETRKKARQMLNMKIDNEQKLQMVSCGFDSSMLSENKRWIKNNWKVRCK